MTSISCQLDDQPSLGPRDTCSRDHIALLAAWLFRGAVWLAVCALPGNPSGEDTVVNPYLQWDTELLARTAKSLISRRADVDTQYLYLEELKYHWVSANRLCDPGLLLQTKFGVDCCSEGSVIVLGFLHSRDLTKDMARSGGASYRRVLVVLPVNGDTAGAQVFTGLHAQCGRKCSCDRRLHLLVSGTFASLGLGRDTLAGWYVLNARPTTSALDTTTIILSEGPGEVGDLTYIRYSRQGTVPSLLLRGPGLHRGTVPTVYCGLTDSGTQCTPQDTTFLWNGEVHRVRAWPDDPIVELARGDLRESLTCGDDCPGMEAAGLLWAGDIDIDGELDFIVLYCGGAGDRTYVLFTSSHSPGQIAQRNARFPTLGN